MSALTHSESTKNSKWLQDAERKVKAVIKILQEDSSGRRAEMYYKNRPELLRLLEEFYGDYIGLAEKYDMVTGALRLAQLSSDKSPSEPQTDVLKNVEIMNYYKQEDDLETLQNQIRCQEEFNHGLITEIGYLKQKKIQSEERISNLSKHLNILNELNGRLEKEIQVHLREKETFEKNLSRQTTDTFDLTKRLIKLASQTEQAIIANTMLKEAFAKYEIERGILFEKNVVLERELENLNVEFNSKLNQSQKYSESLNQEKNDLSTQLHGVNIILKNLESKNEDLEEDYLIISKERDLMQIQLNELNNYSRAKIQDYLNKISEISDKNYELENLVSNLNSQIGDLNSTKSDLSSKVYSLETVFKNLESKYEDLEENYSIISKEKDLMQIQIDDLNNYLKAKNEEYSNKISDLNSQKSLLIAQKDDLSSQLYSTEILMKNLESKNEDLEENYSVVSKERDLMKIELNDLNDFLHLKNQEYLSTVKSHDLYVTNLQNDILSHIAKYEIERQIIFEKNVALEREMENLNVELENFRERANDSKISENGLKNEIMVLEREKKEFEMKVGEIEEKKSDLESNLRKCKLQVEELRLTNELQLNDFKEYVKLNRRISLLISDSELVQEDQANIETIRGPLHLLKSDNLKLQIERDDAVKETEKLQNQLKYLALRSDFTYQELEQATKNFSDSVKIGKGGYGCVYRGYLCGTDVAIKILNSHSIGPVSAFKKEVAILTSVRHPNLVTFMGACPESSALVCEFLSNGSLEDHLKCENSTTLLTWQVRTRIIAEICSALIYLHSNKPDQIIHGDLKPDNVLLDANFVSKLCDFGISRFIKRHDINDTPVCVTNSILGTAGYIDPDYFNNQQFTVKSDVYSFGVIILRLVTGKIARSIAHNVKEARKKKSLSDIIDVRAGKWPLDHANELAMLGLWCSKKKRRKRPDLLNEVLPILDRLQHN